MLSFGTEASRAFSTADASVMLPSTLPPPSRAATSIARKSFANIFERFWSVASFFRLIVDHLEWPDISDPPSEGGIRAAGRRRRARDGTSTRRGFPVPGRPDDRRVRRGRE